MTIGLADGALQASAHPLADCYDLAVLDLDGVVYVGSRATPHAPEALTRVRERLRLAFVTNNAARTPDDVARHLTELGVTAAPADVVTSAQAGARVLAESLPAGSPVFVIGTTGLFVALEACGLRPVTSRAERPVAVIQGYGPDMPWSRVVEGSILVASGLPWVATNLDATLPTDLGIGPGNGALVDLVSRFSGRLPDAVGGKPARPLFDETLLRVGGSRPLMIGDRLDTDIAGANEIGWPTLLVLTGVTGLQELASARPEERPRYLGSDLRSLLEPHPAPLESGGEWSVGSWRARVRAGELEVDGSGARDDWWRCVSAAAWQHLDETGHVAGSAALTPPTERIG